MRDSIPTAFVFVGEDQQHMFSKSTRSTINAQVANYAHKQRRVTVLKSKSVSASSSPPILLSSGRNQAIETVPAQNSKPSKQRNRLISEPVAAKSAQGEAKNALRRWREPVPNEQWVTHPSRSISSRHESDGEHDIAASDTEKCCHTSPEEVTGPSQNTCRTTKYQEYQAFPFT